MTRYLAVFGAAFLALVGGLWSLSSTDGYRAPAIASLTESQLIPTNHLNDWQDTLIKATFAVTAPPPRVALFGNHLVHLMNRADYGGDGFANLAFHHASLEDEYIFLRYLEAKGKLPGRLILVGLSHPLVTNGAHYLGRQGYLPADAYQAMDPRDSVSGLFNLRDAFLTSVQMHTDWRYFIMGLGTTICRRPDIVDIGNVEASIAEPPRALVFERMRDHLPLLWAPSQLPMIGAGIADLTWSGILALRQTHQIRDFCFHLGRLAGYRQDGSYLSLHEPERLVIGQYVQAPTNPPEIKRGDEVRIARLMRDIDALGRRHHLQVVFFVPPIYVEDADYPVYHIFNEALKLVADLNIIDHRDLDNEPVLFMDKLHPGHQYYKILVGELRRRGWLE